MLSIYIIFIIITISTTGAKKEWRKNHPDVDLNSAQLITKYGYPFENHTVYTDDGYILELHRIPYGRNNNNTNAIPVLLVSGILCDSSVWVNMGVENSLGFLLADKGYDVWLGNYRGTTWSRRHVILNADVHKKQFWKFSFHEIGTYDLPAFIDYVLNITNQTKLFYVGFSQGTTSFFALSSTKPEYNRKIRLAAMLAPSAYVGHMKSILTLLNPIIEIVQKIVDITQSYEILRHSRFLTVVGDFLCHDGSPVQNVCVTILSVIAGYSELLNRTILPVITSNVPAGTSFDQLVHYAQLYKSRLYQRFDYGPEENMDRYGQETPPEYDLSKATVPFALYYGDKDILVVPQDTDELAQKLPNVVSKSMVKGYGHLEFLWGIDIVKLLYEDLFRVMEDY